MSDMNVLPDIPRYYTAIAEWLSCCVCLLQVRRKITGVKFWLIAAGFLAVQTVFLTLTPGLHGVLWILAMTVAAALMYLLIYVSAELPWRDNVYCLCGAFVLAELAASLEWQVECFVYLRTGSFVILRSVIILICIYGAVFGIYAKAREQYRDKNNALNITNYEMISCGIIALAVFSVSNIGFLSKNTLFGGTYTMEIYNVRTLVDLGGTVIMYAYHLQRVELRTRNELENVQRMFYNQYAQYKNAREAIAAINYKYHDLKHYIIALRAEENSEKRKEYLDQLEEGFQDYETQYKTGNQIVDVMLTTKGLYCKKHEINLTCMVDGTQFEFMNAMDICSIFGNALDNAIECELKIKDKEKRMIRISTFSQNKLLLIRFENYFEGEVDLGEDLPETTKEDTKYHGYGLKSIRYTAQKYGGAVHVDTDHQWFLLKILIPVK